jgi:hypothetical protein
MRSVKLVAVVLASSWLSSLAGCGRTSDEEVEVKTSALVVNQANVFGFEDVAHWSSTVALSSSSTRTQGNKALGVKAKNYVEVNSAALASLTGATSMLALDVQLPTAQPNPFWYGFVQLLVSAPSKGLSNVFLGTQELTGRPLAQYFRLTFSLPANVVTTLKAGGYNDFTIKLVVNVPSNATGTYLFDNLRFMAECPTACGAHGVCNRTTLACDCETGWAGTSCAACATGFVMQNGACVPSNGGTSSTWPNAFSKAASDPWIAAHHDEIQVVQPNVLVIDFVNTSTPSRDTALVNQIIAGAAEGSRMQGFKNASQTSQLRYQIAKFVDLRDGVNGRPAAPVGFPYQNSTLYPASASVRSSGGSIDYGAFFGEGFANLYGFPDPAQPGRSLTLCELADRGIVHELWVVGSGDVPDAGMAEVLESKQRYTAAGAKIAGSFERCAGNGCFDSTVPICGRSIRIGLVNYNRGSGCFLHSLGHGMESALGGARSPWIFHDPIYPPIESWFAPFANLDLDSKYGLPWRNLPSVPCPNVEGVGAFCFSYPNTTTLRIDNVGPTLTQSPYDPVCGNVHFGPNFRGQYDVCGDGPLEGPCTASTSSQVSTSCIGFGRHGGAGGADQKQTVSSMNWFQYDALAPDCQGAFLVWWFQNMPMFGSGQTFADGARMKSVWPYLYY